MKYSGTSLPRVVAVILSLALLASLFVLPASAGYSTSSPAAGKVVTERDPLNIRAGAGTNYRVVSQADKGTYLQVIGTSGSFYKVMYNSAGKTGYVSKSYLKIVSTGTAKVTTQRDPLVLRKTASTSGKNLAQIPKGTIVPILKKSGNWYQVVYRNQIGYCSATYLTVSGKTPAKPDTSTSTAVLSANIHVYQGSGTSYCTAASAATLLRANCAVQGKSYSHITLDTVLRKAWTSQGLLLEFTVDGADLKAYSLKGSASEKKAKVNSLLKSHPEGIVLYGWKDSGAEHAIYMANNGKILDPYYNSKKYRNLSDSASSASDNWSTIKQYWIIVN